MSSLVSVPQLIVSASTYGTTSGAEAAGAGVAGLLIPVVLYLLGSFALLGMFRKAGRKTWEAFVPFYSAIVLLRIAGMSDWWFLLMLVPLFNLIPIILLAINLAKVFGHGVGVAILTVFFGGIMYFYLSYSSARYLGQQAVRFPFGQAGQGSVGQHGYAQTGPVQH